MNPELLASLLAASTPAPATNNKNSNFAEYVITDANDVFMAFVNIKKDAVPVLETVFKKLKVNLSPKDTNHTPAPTTYAV